MMNIGRFAFPILAALLFITLAGAMSIRKDQEAPAVIQGEPTISLRPEARPSEPPPQTVPATPVQPDYPTMEFKERITKKIFGTYVKPGASPVNPERFTGFHTAVDVEFDDTAADVAVTSVTQGEVVMSRWVSGYGGLTVIKSSVGQKQVYILYGHLRPDSMKQEGREVGKGDKLGVLGTAYTSETDGERRHLHFGIVSATSSTPDIRGYVQSKSELSSWIDPLTALP